MNIDRVSINIQVIFHFLGSLPQGEQYRAHEAVSRFGALVRSLLADERVIDAARIGSMRALVDRRNIPAYHRLQALLASVESYVRTYPLRDERIDICEALGAENHL